MWTKIVIPLWRGTYLGIRDCSIFQTKRGHTTLIQSIVRGIRACLHGGGGPQVGGVTSLGGVTRLFIWSLILIWSHLHDRWDDPPRWVAQSARLGNPLSRGQILTCKGSRRGSPPIGVWFVKHQICTKFTIESNSTEDCSKSSKWVLKSINRQNTWFASIFLVYMLSDHSIILKKCTPGWRVVRLHVKEGYCFTSPKGVTSPTWGPPPPCKQALSRNWNQFFGVYLCGKPPWSLWYPQLTWSLWSK